MGIGWDNDGVRSRKAAERIVNTLGRDEKGIISITDWALTGSRAASCALELSDLDLGVTISSPTDENTCLERCRDIVVAELKAVDVVLCKRSTRSPAVLRWWDAILQCSIDLAFIIHIDSNKKNSSAITSLKCAREVRNTLLIGSLCRANLEYQMLLRLVKQWTHCRGLAYVLPGTLLMSLTLHFFDKSTGSDIIDYIIKSKGEDAKFKVSSSQATPSYHLEQIFLFFRYLSSVMNHARASAATPKTFSKVVFAEARVTSLKSWSGEAAWKQEETLNDSCDPTDCDIIWVQEPASPRLMALDASKLTTELARVSELEGKFSLTSVYKKPKSVEETFSEIASHPLFQHYTTSMASCLKSYKRKLQDSHLDNHKQPVKGMKFSEEFLGCGASSSSSDNG